MLAGVSLNRQAGDPADYLDLLAGAGCSVDAWETTYLHVLHGPDPVVEWYRGTGLRPVLAALDPGQAEQFLADYGKRIDGRVPGGALRHRAAVPQGVRGRAGSLTRGRVRRFAWR